VWENAATFGLFQVPPAMRCLPDADAALQEALQTDDFRARGAAAGACPERQSGSVSGVRVLPDGFDLGVETRSGAVVVSSVSYTGGWVARAGDRELATRLVNGGFLGFEAPPGTNHVRLRYRPFAWRAGLGFFVLGLGLAALLRVAKGRWRAFAWL
jgi:hypothetical protein